MNAPLPDPSAEIAAALLQCPACRSRLQIGRPVSSLEEKCPVCGAEVSMTIFPRLYSDPTSRGLGEPVSEGEASCSFFPDLKAEKVCDECGGFLSSKASLIWEGRDLCLPCLHRLREVERSRDYLAKAPLYDKRALVLVTWLAPFSLFTAPLALFLLFRYRDAPMDFVPRGKTIWWTALVLSLLWLALWCAFFVVWISLILGNLS